MPLNGIKCEHRVTRLARRAAGSGAYLAIVLGAAFILSITGGDVPDGRGNDNAATLADIVERGRLRVAMPQGYMRWFDGGDGLSGFEHDLLRAFASEQGFELDVVVVRHPRDALSRLAQGDVDMAAGSIGKVMADRLSLTTTAPITQSRYQIVSSPAVDSVDSPIHLNGLSVVVEAGSNSIGILQAITAASPLTQWSVNQIDGSESLLAQLSVNEIDATVVDSRTALIMQHHYPDLHIGYQFPQSYPIVWALASDAQGDLVAEMNRFIDDEIRHGTLAVLEERYTNPASSQGYLDLMAFRHRVDDTLPRFRHMFIDAANKTGNDWRLIAALSYQESMWDPEAESPTGVQGLMQLTTDTAQFLKVDRHDPAASIDGASRYINWLRTRLPESIDEPDRTWLALASYNLGPGHVDDALSLTAERGGNPDRWNDVKKILPLLEDAAIAQSTKFGVARGSEALTHVTRVRGFYKVLARLEDEAETPYQADITGIVHENPVVVAVTIDGRPVSTRDAENLTDRMARTEVASISTSGNDASQSKVNSEWLKTTEQGEQRSDYVTVPHLPVVVPASLLLPAQAPSQATSASAPETALTPQQLSRLNTTESNNAPSEDVQTQ